MYNCFFPAETHTEWEHPRKGRMNEDNCDEHSGELLHALHTLGIGCLSYLADKNTECGRCLARNAGVEYRFFRE
jgi:hypothetical protein